MRCVRTRKVGSIHATRPGMSTRSMVAAAAGFSARGHCDERSAMATGRGTTAATTISMLRAESPALWYLGEVLLVLSLLLVLPSLALGVLVFVRELSVNLKAFLGHEATRDEQLQLQTALRHRNECTQSHFRRHVVSGDQGGCMAS